MDIPTVDEIEKNIKENIRQLRKCKGLSQEKFANLFNMDRQRCTKWEKIDGNVLPDINELRDICNFFQYDMYSFVTESFSESNVDNQSIYYGDIFLNRNMKNIRIIQGLRIDNILTMLQVKCSVYTNSVTYSEWESGKYYPSVINILGIAQVLDIPFEDLVFKEPTEYEELNKSIYGALNGNLKELREYLEYNDDLSDYFVKIIKLEKQLVEQSKIEKQDKWILSDYIVFRNELFTDEEVMEEVSLRSVVCIEYYSSLFGIECEEIFRPIIDELLKTMSKYNFEKAEYYRALLIFNGVIFEGYASGKENEDYIDEGWALMEILYRQNNKYAKRWAEERGYYVDEFQEMFEDEYDENEHDEDCYFYVSDKSAWSEDDLKSLKGFAMTQKLNQMDIPGREDKSSLWCNEDGYVIGTLDELDKYIVYVETDIKETVVHISSICKNDLIAMSIAQLENVNWRLCNRCCYRMKTEEEKKKDEKRCRSKKIKCKKSDVFPEWLKGLKDKLGNE